MASKHMKKIMFSIISRQGNAHQNHNEVHHACVRRAKLKVSSTKSSSDAGKVDHSHTDGETVTPENGLAATHAIYHATSNYTARQLPQRNEHIGSKPKSHIKVFTVVLIIIPQSWKRPRRLSERTAKHGACSQTMEYSSARETGPKSGDRHP